MDRRVVVGEPTTGQKAATLHPPLHHSPLFDRCWKMLATAWKTRGKLIESIHRQIIRCSFVQFIVIYNYNLTPIVEKHWVTVIHSPFIPLSPSSLTIRRKRWRWRRSRRCGTRFFPQLQWKTANYRQLFREENRLPFGKSRTLRILQISQISKIALYLFNGKSVFVLKSIAIKSRQFCSIKSPPHDKLIIYI